MSTAPLTPIVSAFSVTTSYSVAYTVPAGTSRVGIDSVVFNNYTANNETFSVRISQSGADSVLEEVITDKAIRDFSNDLAPAMIGQSITEGGEIQVKASSNDAINLNVTGTVITE